VFSTYLYKGNNSTQTITNNIDLSGQGGLVWIKNRSASSTNHSLFDSESGATGGKKLRTNLNAGIQTFNGSNVFTTSSTGFALNNDASNDMNDSTYDYVSWSFRKAPKFFDVVTYTGNGTSQTISHDLEGEVGFINVKCTSTSGSWATYHRSLGTSKVMFLDLSQAQVSNSNFFTSVTSSNFSVGSDSDLNANGQTYVAYIFAHNNNDGEFGSTADQDIIKCGSYSGNGSASGPDINLGFEPQWIITKAASVSNEDWRIKDVMRGWHFRSDTSDYGDSQDESLAANESATTQELQMGHPTATGFKLDSNDGSYNQNGQTYIYMAIRRGSLNVPEDATKVFAIGERGQDSPPPTFRAGFPVDFFMTRSSVTAANWYSFTRLFGNVKGLIPNDVDAEQTLGGQIYEFDQMQGVGSNTTASSNVFSWMWKRASGYFDIVGYQGTGSAGFTFNHNLGVKPEMIWVKNRGASEYWAVYHKGLNGGTNPSHYFLRLNDTYAEADYNEIWNDTEPTATQVTVGQQGVVNSSSFRHVAYLFASAPGVSKISSYTGNGSAQNIECGFSSGARFVLIRKTTGSSDMNWWVFDTVRGLVSGDDQRLFLNTTAAQYAADYVDPYSGGFSVGSFLSENGQTYIFYAIA
jgi:hypothetical protein